MQAGYPGTDFASAMRDLLRERGISYRALAARTYYSKSHLHSLAGGGKRPTADAASRIDAALGADGRLVDLARVRDRQDRRISLIDTDEAMDETGDVYRRAVIAALAGLAAGELVNNPSPAGLLRDLIAQDERRHTADDWAEAIWEHGFTYVSAPRATFLQDATMDLAILQRTLPAAVGADRAGLHESGARLAALVAMACTDNGDHREGRAVWRMARRWAVESGSAECEAWVRGQEALTGIYAHRPLPVILDLAERGLAQRSPKPTVGTAVLLAAKTQALAEVDPAAATATLADLRSTFDRLPDSATASSATIFCWAERRLRHVESSVASRIGQSHDAHAAHDAALTVLSPSARGPRCQIDMHRAARLVSDGHISEGLGFASASLDDMASDQPGRYVLALAAKVLDRVPAGVAASPQVGEYRERLAYAGWTQS